MIDNKYNYDIKFFAWCHQNGHDKIWGYATLGSDDQTFYNFYGRRGKRFTFKRYYLGNILRELAREKTAPGRKTGTYVAVEVRQIETIVEGFYEEFSRQLALAKLFDNFHGEQPFDDDVE